MVAVLTDLPHQKRFLETIVEVIINLVELLCVESSLVLCKFVTQA